MIKNYRFYAPKCLFWFSLNPGWRRRQLMMAVVVRSFQLRYRCFFGVNLTQHNGRKATTPRVKRDDDDLVDKRRRTARQNVVGYRLVEKYMLAWSGEVVRSWCNYAWGNFGWVELVKLLILVDHEHITPKGFSFRPAISHCKLCHYCFVLLYAYI